MILKEQEERSSYLGNTKLKRDGVLHAFTQEQILEYAKCASDPIHFVKNYVKIVHIDRGIIPFELWPFQEEMILASVENRFVIAKMPRQVGKTTTICALILWYILFHENFSAAILAHKQKGAHEILSRIKLAYENLPKWLQQGIIEWNGGSIELENGSKVMASATTSSAIRGGTFSLVYMDELAFVPNNLQEAFFASVYPVISSAKTSKILITSTPNGLNMFYKLWKDSEDGKNSYRRVDVHWSQIPGRDEAWKQETIRNTSQAQFDVEFECHFLGSSNTLISGAVLQRLVWEEPEHRDEHFAIYEEALPNHAYVIVVDTSRGSSIDASAFIVFDVTSYPYRVVARFKDNEISPLVYPDYIYKFAMKYNEAFVLIEINDIGQQVSDILYYELEYENILITQSKGRAGVQVGGGFGGNTKPSFGIRTTTSVKRIGCANFKTLVESDKLIINDEALLNEMYRFIQVKNSYEAEEGAHDDLVMCCVLFAWLTNQEYFKDVTSMNIRAKLSEENQTIMDQELLPFGILDDGLDDVEEEIPQVISVNAFDDWLRL